MYNKNINKFITYLKKLTNKYHWFKNLRTLRRE